MTSSSQLGLDVRRYRNEACGVSDLDTPIVCRCPVHVEFPRYGRFTTGSLSLCDVRVLVGVWNSVVYDIDQSTLLKQGSVRAMVRATRQGVQQG